ncbi:MAG: hypothetical protein IPL27_16720 [Lewinellaceae bacterium]|nr:hypothetical protein [Lewinellaceae bacterium]
MQANTIQEVIEALDAIIRQCEMRDSRQAYFAVLYKGMTEAVRDAIVAGQFEDAARMERLDVLFANRYLDAWQRCEQQQTPGRSWQAAFDACDDDALIVLQHLILGINTHINLDLAIAAALTAPGDTVFALQRDFEKINDIISALTDDMQMKLERIWWPMRLIRRVMRGRDKAVIEFSIVKARQAAWANSVALAQLPEPAVADYIDQMDKTVTSIAGNIARPKGWVSHIIRFVRWWEPKEVGRVIGLLR